MPNITALEILKQTRELFANTHWTTGTLYQVTDSGKKQFCMVGGLCYVFASGENPEWIEESEDHPTFYPGAVAQWPNEDKVLASRFADLSAILDAELELAKTIDPELPDDAPPSLVEDTIVGWNDSAKTRREFEERGNAGYILEVMDETIKRVESAQQS